MATLHKMGEIRKGPALEEVERLAMHRARDCGRAKVYDAGVVRQASRRQGDGFCRANALRRTRERLLALQKNRRASAANTSYELFSA
jgi:hypothetical protein